MSSGWSKDVTARIGAEVKRLRGKRSAQWLADQTGELGHPIPRTTISETENGRRSSITVQELVVLAQALDVPPIELLYPGIPAATVEMLPGRTATAWIAAQEFSGEMSRDTLTGLARQLDTARRNLKFQEDKRRYAKTPDAADGAGELVEHYQQQVSQTEDRIRQAGGVVDDER